MSAQELREIRAGLGFTQAEMARRMGVSLRAYSDAEGGVPARRYLLAAGTVAIMVAAERSDPGLLTQDLRDECLALAALARGEPPHAVRPAEERGLGAPGIRRRRGKP